jgi:hypothetical protein
MDRLYRILGRQLVDEWIERGSIESSAHLLANIDLSEYDTPEKREKLFDWDFIMQTFSSDNRLARTDSYTVMLHPNYTLAAIENLAWCVEFEKAQMIQKRMRGWLDREKIWSPYTEIGQRRLLRIFSS